MVLDPLLVSDVDPLNFVGLERSHLRSTVYRRVFGDDAGALRIGRYSILQRIGAGARGVVFKAFDNQLDRLVALKVLSTRADDHAELIREAKALARLSHPNVLGVYEVGETGDGQVFLATEFVKGWTLGGWYEEEHRSERAVVELMQQVAMGVQAAHDEGLVHRDLKPANILVGTDGRVRVADFGLARFDPTAVDPETAIPRNSVATTTAGTPGYMAPELFRGVAASPASDQFALAVTLRELVSIQGREPSSPIANAIRRASADAPEARFPSVTAFADAMAAGKRSRVRLGAVAAGVLAAASAAVLLLPRTETDPDVEVALLRARTELPGNPAAALDALRPVAAHPDTRVLALAEDALAKGPELARWSLPESIRKRTLVGDLLIVQDEHGTLAVHRMTRNGLVSINPDAAGLAVDPDRSYLGSRQFHYRVVDFPALLRTSPIAAREVAASHTKFGLSADGTRFVHVDAANQEIIVSDAKTGMSHWSRTFDAGEPRSVSIGPSGRRIAWTDSVGAGFVHDLESESTIEVEPAAADLVFSNDPDVIIARGKYTGLFEVHLGTGQSTRLLDDDVGFSGTQLGASGAWLVTRENTSLPTPPFGRGTVRIGRMEPWTTTAIEGDGFAFSPSGERLAVYNGEEVTVRALLSTDTRTLALPADVIGTAFVEEHTVATLTSDNVVRLHAIEFGRYFDELGVKNIALFGDGTRAVTSTRYTARTWDLESGENRLLAELGWEVKHIGVADATDQVAVSGHSSTEIYDFAGTFVANAPPSSVRPQATKSGDWVGAGVDGLWRLHGNEVSTLTTESCGSLLVLGKTIVATCERGASNPFEAPTSSTLRVWEDGNTQELQLEQPVRRATLHVWPDEDHLVALGLSTAMFERKDDGYVRRPVPPSLVDFMPLLGSSASSRGHDLLVANNEGLHTLWDPNEEPVRIGNRPTRTVALSQDGLRYAYSTVNGFIVRERPFSRANHDLPAVLANHTVSEKDL